MQHAVVSYEILHNYLLLFSIAQRIRMLQKATTASVMHGSCGYIQQEMQGTYVVTLRRVRITTADMKGPRIYNYECLFTYYCLTYPLCKAHAPYHTVIPEMSGYVITLIVITHTAQFS